MRVNSNISDLFFNFETPHFSAAVEDVKTSLDDQEQALEKDAEFFLQCAGDIGIGLTKADLACDFLKRI